MADVCLQQPHSKFGEEAPAVLVGRSSGDWGLGISRGVIVLRLAKSGNLVLGFLVWFCFY